MILKSIFRVLLLLFSSLILGATAHAQMILDGKTLTPDLVTQIANEQSLSPHKKTEVVTQVEISPEALQRMEQSFKLLVEATAQNINLYGVNHGVGGNKKNVLYSGSLLSPEAIEASVQFNAQNLRATSAGMGPDSHLETVRAAMVIRLNDFLVGRSGARPEVAKQLALYLNKGITPAVPTIGSVGEADISLMSHIGLTLMGEGDVWYNGEKMKTSQALKHAGVSPIKLFGADSLAIMSSNAFGEALTLEALQNLKKLSRVHELILAMSIEGVDGTTSHFYGIANDIRSIPGLRGISDRILSLLKGSYLLESNVPGRNADGLSYTSAPHHLATLQNELKKISDLLTRDLNSSTNHPAFVVADGPNKKARGQELNSFIRGKEVSGYVLSTSGFEPFHWAVQLNTLKNIVNQLTIDSALRTYQLGKSEVTGLPKFLATEGQLGFSAIHKTVGHLMNMNQNLAQSNITNNMPMAGGGEDIATQLPQTAKDINTMIENLRSVLSIELLHAAQALDLRIKANPNLKIGRSTKKTLEDLRKTVSFLDQDRRMSDDIANANSFLERLEENFTPKKTKAAKSSCRSLYTN